MSVSNALVDEVVAFVTNFQKLQKLFSETTNCLDQIDYNESLTEDLMLKGDEEVCLKRKLDLLPRFLILGRCQSSRIHLVNDLISRPIFPSFDSVLSTLAHERSWRTIRIKYGTTSLSNTVLNSNGVDPTSPNGSGISLATLTLAKVISSNSRNFHRDCCSASKMGRRSQSLGRTDGGGSLTLSSGVSSEVQLGCANDYSKISAPKDSNLELPIIHPLLAGGADILLPSYDSGGSFRQMLQESVEGVLPIVVYVVGQSLCEKDADDLAEMKSILPDCPFLFVRGKNVAQSDLPESDWYSPLLKHSSKNSTVPASRNSHASATQAASHPSQIYLYLSHLGYFDTSANSQSSSGNLSYANSPYVDHICAGDTHEDYSHGRGGGGASEKHVVAKPNEAKIESHKSEESSIDYSACGTKLGSDQASAIPEVHLKSYFVENNCDFQQRISNFSRAILTTHCVRITAALNDLHTRLLNAFILTAFDMQRDQLITPKRIDFARQQESTLYDRLLATIQHQQEQIQVVIRSTVDEVHEKVMRCFAEQDTPEDFFDMEASTCSNASSSSYVGMAGPRSLCTTKDVQTFVLRQLNFAIAERLAESFRCLRVSFIDTVSRCLKSLERMDTERRGVLNQQTVAASEAFTEILNATYSVEVTLDNGRTLLQMLWEKMKQAVSHSNMDSHSFAKLGQLDEPTRAFMEEARLWRQRIANDVIAQLSEVKLARSICAQLKDRLRLAHEAFHAALNNLDSYHKQRLCNAEDHHLRLRKQHAPRMARMTLESLALRDVLLQGMPLLGPEIGRGQYGVVYACEKWGNNLPCAIKSVVPPDDKHWNDLALEFFYTKNLPPHKRVVRLYGAVIDHNYGGGFGAGMGAVLLIMERLRRDLYTGIRLGLSWPARLRVALDVVQGIRYLHSQGLVHRDIKLKNVLLDDHDRGKITDLGFCKPEAMMSGSVVGTPIHMAPELFSGSYDNSVDVYAFGVLFWYICAGHVRLPQSFEACASKDQLWNSVRKGIRPERLTVFDNVCWDLMSSCWSGDKANRPHLGDIQPVLEKLLDDYKTQSPTLEEGAESLVEFPSAGNTLPNQNKSGAGTGMRNVCGNKPG